MIIKPPKPGLGFGFWDFGFWDLVWLGLGVAIRHHQQQLSEIIIRTKSCYSIMICFRGSGPLTLINNMQEKIYLSRFHPDYFVYE